MKTGDVVRFQLFTGNTGLYEFVGYDFSVEGKNCVITIDGCITEIHANTDYLVLVCARENREDI
ncbi:hypothetical protein 015DV002_217 [Bacillus phage 015DV002]|nr:hypothetical protein 000TH008_228 [Bacillus phage 000TH008]QQO40921.1 hypothetical protein 000TH009_228 [Bacillus phage 000TH009]QQO41171.1 hypothetical protein 015DV002_217 [Bacillus phage 015DV002]QQO41448.1 hypothetical protein 015DV004_233 [Bacillus phage 015DV004]